MRYYFAPMEGITDEAYRRLHRKYFPGVDRYYTPFFSPTVHRALTPRETRELPPAHKMDVPVIPQILTKNAEDFLWMAGVCRDLGYPQVNLNVGCPSGTVTAKGKGAGMLRDLPSLESFLDKIFAQVPVPISVKTRLGLTQPEEFYQILTLYNRYPIAELTVHPRTRQDFYTGALHMEMFSYAFANSNAPLCYNGDLCSVKQIQELSAQMPGINAVMVGRALIGDPGMFTPGGTTAKQLEGFLQELFEEYAVAFGSTRNAMFRLKENWRYLFCLFEENDKLRKQLRKATDVNTYNAVTREILHNLPMRSAFHPDW